MITYNLWYQFRWYIILFRKWLFMFCGLISCTIEIIMVSIILSVWHEKHMNETIIFNPSNTSLVMASHLHGRWDISVKKYSHRCWCHFFYWKLKKNKKHEIANKLFLYFRMFFFPLSRRHRSKWPKSHDIWSIKNEFPWRPVIPSRCVCRRSPDCAIANMITRAAVWPLAIHLWTVSGRNI